VHMSTQDNKWYLGFFIFPKTFYLAILMSRILLMPEKDPKKINTSKSASKPRKNSSLSQERARNYKSRVESLEDRLYSNTYKPSPDERRKMDAQNIDLGDTIWDDNKEKKRAFGRATKSSSFLRNFFLFALLLCVLAGGYLWWTLTQGRVSVSNENITIDMRGKTFVDGGEDIDFEVDIINRNVSALTLVDLVIEYEKNTDEREGFGIETIRVPLGTIEPGEQLREEFDIALFGEEGDRRTVTAKLEYRIPNSSSIFVAENSFVVGIRSAPLIVDIKAPDRVIANQEMILDIELITNSDEALEDILIKVDYPTSFSINSFTREPDFGKHTWYFDRLEAGERVSFQVTGTIGGVTGDERTFRVETGSQSDSDERLLSQVYHNDAHGVALESIFLATDLILSGINEQRIAYDNAGEVEGKIRVTNQRANPLADVEIIASLDGDLYAPGSVRVSNGSYNSNSERLVWTRDSYARLGLINPGESEEVSFSFDLESLIDDTGVPRDVDPLMDIVVAVRAVGQGGTAFTAEGLDRTTIAVNSVSSLQYETLYQEGGLPNSGPIPPEVGQRTTYSLRWSITNSSNELSEAQVISKLPNNIEWTGVFTPQSSNITYNTQTREIVWRPGQVVAGAGGAIPAPEVVFQVALTPSLEDNGTFLPLTREVFFSAQDVFTNQELTQRKSSHTTRLQGDSIENNGIVGGIQ